MRNDTPGGADLHVVETTTTGTFIIPLLGGVGFTYIHCDKTKKWIKNFDDNYGKYLTEDRNHNVLENVPPITLKIDHLQKSITKAGD